MKDSVSAMVILVLIMLLIVLGALFWFLYRDYDDMRDQAVTAQTRATRIVQLEQEAGQIRSEADGIAGTRTALANELATAVFNQKMIEQEAVSDQQTIHLLETRVATQTAVIEQNLAALTESAPIVQIVSPMADETVILSQPVDLVVSAVDLNGLAVISIVFDGNPSLDIPLNGETSTVIQEPWPMSEAGTHTATVRAINSNNISSQAVSVTVTAESVRTGQQIADAVANIIGPAAAAETAVSPAEFQAADSDKTAVTPLIASAFDFQTEADPAIPWGAYCQPANPAPVSAPETLVDSPANELAIAQAHTREWQESRYQLSQRLTAAQSDDARAALCALAAGHQRWVLTEYIRRAPAARQAALTDALPPIGDQAGSDILAAQQHFDDLYGPSFAEALANAAGPMGISNAWDNPPSTTAQILHPEQYLAGVEPTPVTLPDLTPFLGNEWTVLAENVLGEWMLGQYLANYVAADVAETAVTGWDGDRYALYQQGADGPVLLVMQVNWASPAQAEIFADVYTEYVNGRFVNAAVPQNSPENSTCWTGLTAETICLYQNEATTFITIAQEDNLAVDSLEELIGD